MSFLMFSKNSAKKIGLVVDVGSGSVGGAVYEKGTDGKPEILYSSREPIAYQNVITGKHLLNAMLRSLDVLLIRLEKYCLPRPGSGENPSRRLISVDAVISSPWHMSETKNLTLKQQKPFTVTPALIEGLLAKEEEAFIGALPGVYGRDLDVKPIEHKIIEMRLNGYSTAEPHGKKATELELKIFTSVSPKRISERMETLLFRRFPGVSARFHAFSLAAFVSIRDFYPEIENFMVVQVGGEVTDVTLVRKSLIAETVSFPLGHNGLMRSLDRICANHPRCTLEGLLNMHRQSKADSPDKRKVDEAIEEVKLSWLELFNSAAGGFFSGLLLPGTIFLFENGSYLRLFDEFLRGEESGRFTVKVETFAVKTLGGSAGVLPGAGRPDDADSILAMEADFAARF